MASASDHIIDACVAVVDGANAVVTRQLFCDHFSVCSEFCGVCREGRRARSSCLSLLLLILSAVLSIEVGVLHVG